MLRNSLDASLPGNLGPQRAPTGAPGPDSQTTDTTSDILKTLAWQHPDDGVFELCIIAPKQATSKHWEGRAFGRDPIVAGWFRDQDKAAALAAQLPPAAGVYITLNPCREDLLSRVNERLKANVSRTTDKDIAVIQNLLVDIDAIRLKGISSTDAEHQTAIEVAELIRADLAGEGWPEPLVADSGNGAHLTYPLYLPNTGDTAALLKSVLAALARRYADNLARLGLDLDLKVFNASRLTKLYGTWVRKGDNTPDRPHRQSKILSPPPARRPVLLELLQAMAATLPPQEDRQGKANGSTTDGRLDVGAYLAHYGIEVIKEKPWQGSTLYCLKECIFDKNHEGNEAAIGQAADGILFYQCFHNSCRGRTWHDAREKISGKDSLAQFMPGFGSMARGRVPAGAWPEPEPLRRAERQETAPWPEMAREAFYGLAGEFVHLVEPHTESDPAGLLMQFHTGFGNLINKGAYAVVEADTHYCNLFGTAVGETAKARKGTSWGWTKRILTTFNPAWQGRVKSGLSSGEGLIFQVRDPIVKRESKKKNGMTVLEDVTVDEGESDKRLLVVEPEFANVLRQLEREGNILSSVIRDAWDTGTLATLTKNNPTKATGAHVSIVGHITNGELRRYLTRTEAGNGFGNRFLWYCVRRSKVLPEGGRFAEVDFAPFLKKLSGAVNFAVGAGEVTRSPEARALWAEVYRDLSEGKPGLLGALTSRAEAQVLRLSMVYALLDGERVVRVPHLLAALAVWDYCEASVKYIFGQALGDPVADAILEALQSAPDGHSRTEINNLFGRHRRADRIQQAIGELRRRGLVSIETVTTGGRPTEILKYNRDAKKAKKAN